MSSVTALSLPPPRRRRPSERAFLCHAASLLSAFGVVLHALSHNCHISQRLVCIFRFSYHHLYPLRQSWSSCSCEDGYLCRSSPDASSLRRPSCHLPRAFLQSISGFSLTGLLLAATQLHTSVFGHAPRMPSVITSPTQRLGTCPTLSSIHDHQYHALYFLLPPTHTLRVSHSHLCPCEGH